MNLGLGLVLILLLCLLSSFVAAAKARKREPPQEATKAVKLNVDILPALQDVLHELGIAEYLRDFVRMGVTETRLLLKLSAMDFQIMGMDWQGFSKEHVGRLKERIALLLQMATVQEDAVRPEVELRKKLTYGRLFLQYGVQSFEYALASFGGPPPIGEVRLRLSSTLNECNATDANYGGDMVLARRGDCSFLSKARFAKQHNASGLLIVNTEDHLDSPASGHGIDPNITEASVLALGQFVVLGLANTSWAPLLHALRYQQQHQHLTEALPIHIVPIKCHAGGKCLPMLDEERRLQAEVSWGRMRVRRPASRQARTFEFLASNFGSPLPVDKEISLIWADPVDACTAVANVSSAGEVALAAHRGSCRFDVKALNAQAAGARMLVVVDVEDQALQRIGAMAPEAGYIGIPSVLVTAEVGDFLRTADAGEEVLIELFPSADTSGFDNWLEVAYTVWAEDEKERTMQLQGMRQKFQETESHDIVSWLQRRLNEIDFSNRKAIDTDEL